MRPTTRRRLLAACGATAAMAGCVGPAKDLELNEFLGTSNDGDGAGPGDIAVEYPAIDDGELLDDFANVDPWGINYGHREVDTSTAARGEQSLRVASGDHDSIAGVFTRFDDGLDLEGRHLSLAVRVQTDGPARLSTSLLAPGRSDRLISHRRVNPALDGWMRVDVGYTTRGGEPDLSSVRELRITAESVNDQPVTLHLDDLRATPADDTGYAVLVFDNALASFHDVAKPHLDERDAAGVVPVNHQIINAPGRLSVADLRAMRDDGWDVASRPSITGTLPERSADEQRRLITSNRDYLRSRGFEDGAQHFFAPRHQLGSATVEVLREEHETGYTFGGCPMAGPPVTRYTGSMFNADDGDSTRRLIDFAGTYRQTAVLSFPDVGPESHLTEADFVDLLAFIEEQDLEIVTLTELYDR